MLPASDQLPPTSGELTVVDARQPVALDHVALAQLMRARIEAALARLAPGSRRQYERALAHFAAWVNSSEAAATTLGLQPLGSWPETLVAMLRAGPLVAATLVERFLDEGCAGKAPATIAQRLAAIKWAVRLAREAGIVLWELHVRAPKVRAYRDTRGPGLDGFRALLAVAQTLPEHQRLRDMVLLGLLFILGLRRAEVTALRVGDVDLGGRQLWIVGKGRQEREPMSTPAALAEHIRRYLEARGELPADAPLLANHDPARKGTGGLTPNGIYRRIVHLSAHAGLAHVTPHGLRHCAITAALDALNGDVRRVRAFARHAKAETTLVYDDRRRDIGGEVAEALAVVACLPVPHPANG